jgi:hypothetical protein
MARVSWKTIVFLVSLNIPYLILVLGPYFVYRMPWRKSYSDPRGFWPYDWEGVGAIIWLLARAVAEVTPVVLPLAVIIMFSNVRPFWQYQGTRAKAIISLSIAITGLVGISSWFLNPNVTYWLYD